MLEKEWPTVKVSNTWAGPLSRVFRNGSSKQIFYKHDDDALIKELLKDEVGYLVCHSRILADTVLQKGGVELIKKLGLKLWFHVSDFRDPEVVETLSEIGVPSLSNYSAGAIGADRF